MKTKEKDHTQLLEGCYRTEISVYPANWQTKKAPVTKKGKNVEWYVWYRFYDPAHQEAHPDGKLVKRRRMNKFSDLTLRQAATKEILALEQEKIDVMHYNPITEKYMQPEPAEDDLLVDPKTPFIAALEKGLELKEMDEETKKDIKNKIPHVKKAAEGLKVGGKPVASMPICDIRRKHMRLILNRIGKDKGEKWTANNFNRYRTDLHIVFSELNELEAMEVNPMDGIKRRKATRAPRAVLTPGEWDDLNGWLKENDYPFWRFLHIFSDSGARETEMVGVQAQHVNLEKQEFKVLVKKRSQYEWVTKSIGDDVLQLWQEVIDEASTLKSKSNGSGQHLYLFSVGLAPRYRDRPIRPDQITKRWYRVKKKKGITADFYSFKHRRTTSDIDKMVDAAIAKARRQAAKKNSHTTTAMVEKVYDVNKGRRSAIIRQLKMKKQRKRKAVVLRTKSGKIA